MNNQQKNHWLHKVFSHLSLTDIQKTCTSHKIFAMRRISKCGAHARSTGNPCQAKALTNGRCKNHGGMSTGPKTPEGRRAISQATRQRMSSGGRMRVLEGFYRWLEGGGREVLSRLASIRERRKRWKRLMEKKIRPSHRRF